MTQETSVAELSLSEAAQLLSQLDSALNEVLVGQEKVVKSVLITLLSGGHMLIEGVPGLGKTLLVRALGRCFGGEWSRIQFTPDLMPSDITGHAIYDMKSETFKIRRGPVFTNVLLADEINRAPAKTQSALLEVMQEHRVTIEGKQYHSLTPFIVLATQNPLEHEGTYPLPEAELDRFMTHIQMGYPALEAEKQLVQLVTNHHFSANLDEALPVILSPEKVIALQVLTTRILVDEQVLEYAISLVRATRDWHGIQVGAGPRASIALIRTAKAHALLNEREYIIPDDIKTVAAMVLRHRIKLTAALEIEGADNNVVIQDILNSTEAPRV